MEQSLFDRMNNACAALTEDTPERDEKLVFYWARREGIDEVDLTDAMAHAALRIVALAGPEAMPAVHLIMSAVGFGFMTGWELQKAEAMNSIMEEG